MTNAQIVQTIIEFVVVALLIVGLAYEPVVANWEEKQKEKVLKALKERKRLRK